MAVHLSTRRDVVERIENTPAPFRLIFSCGNRTYEAEISLSTRVSEIYNDAIAFFREGLERDIVSATINIKHAAEQYKILPAEEKTPELNKQYDALREKLIQILFAAENDYREVPLIQITARTYLGKLWSIKDHWPIDRWPQQIPVDFTPDNQL